MSSTKNVTLFKTINPHVLYFPHSCLLCCKFSYNIDFYLTCVDAGISFIRKIIMFFSMGFFLWLLKEDESSENKQTQEYLWTATSIQLYGHLLNIDHLCVLRGYPENLICTCDLTESWVNH